MKFRSFSLYAWVTLIIISSITYVFFPQFISIAILKSIVGNYLIISILIYYLLLTFQGVIFMPSPLIIVGVLLFNPIELFVANMAGIVTSAIIVYYFSKYLEFDIYFEDRYKNYSKKLKEALKHKELIIITLWSCLPVTPTNFVVYIASVLRVNIFKCLLGVFIGESIINIFYIIILRMIFANIVPQ